MITKSVEGDTSAKNLDGGEKIDLQKHQSPRRDIDIHVQARLVVGTEDDVSKPDESLAKMAKMANDRLGSELPPDAKLSHKLFNESNVPLAD